MVDSRSSSAVGSVGLSVSFWVLASSESLAEEVELVAEGEETSISSVNLTMRTTFVWRPVPRSQRRHEVLHALGPADLDNDTGKALSGTDLDVGVGCLACEGVPRNCGILHRR